jgi:hypothetical protein
MSAKSKHLWILFEVTSKKNRDVSTSLGMTLE